MKRLYVFNVLPSSPQWKGTILTLLLVRIRCQCAGWYWDYLTKCQRSVGCSIDNQRIIGSPHD